MQHPTPRTGSRQHGDGDHTRITIADKLFIVADDMTQFDVTATSFTDVERLLEVFLHTDTGIAHHTVADRQRHLLIIEGISHHEAHLRSHAILLVEHLDDGGFDSLTIAMGHVDVLARQQTGHHILVELYDDGITVGMGILHLWLYVLLHADVDVELWRGNGQPLREGGLIALLLEFYLPEALRHIPAVVTLGIGEERILLTVLLSIPHHDVLFPLAIHILYHFLIEDGGRHAFQTVRLHRLINKARGIIDGFLVSTNIGKAVRVVTSIEPFGVLFP